MAENIVQSLFGPTPYDVEQARRQQQMDYAAKVAGMNNIQQAKFGIGQGAGGFGRSVGGMMGLVDPMEEQAKAREQALTNIDLSSSDAILRTAMQTQDPRLKVQLTLMAQQRKAAEQKAAQEGQKMALDERKQGFKENQEYELRKMQIEANINNQKAILENKSASLEEKQRAAMAMEELRRMQIQNNSMYQQGMLEVRRSQGEKPLNPMQRMKIQKDLGASASELSSVEQSFDTMKKAAEVLVKHPGLPAATGISGALPSLPGGQAAQAEALLEEFKALLKNQGLQMVREGGSIGQMTVQEWPIVEAMIANVDPRKLGLEGTKAQIQKAVARAEQIAKRASKTHEDLVSSVPSDAVPQKTGVVDFRSLK